MVDDGFRARDGGAAFFGAENFFALAFFALCLLAPAFFATALFVALAAFFGAADFFAAAFFAAAPFFAVAAFFGAAPRFLDALPLFAGFFAGFVLAAARLGAFAAGALRRALFAVVFFSVAFAGFVCFFALMLRAYGLVSARVSAMARAAFDFCFAEERLRRSSPSHRGRHGRDDDALASRDRAAHRAQRRPPRRAGARPSGAHAWNFRVLRKHATSRSGETLARPQRDRRSEARPGLASVR